MHRKKTDISPSVTQHKFIVSLATIAVLIGPQGEGKTWAGAHGMVNHYYNTGKKLRGLLIRDTLTNIISKTIIDVEKALGVKPVISGQSSKTLTIPGLPDLQVELVGMRDKGSLNRIQGGGYNFVWIEEAAPVYEVGSSGGSLGVPLEAFLTALTRASREGNARVQVTMNPGSEDHWTYSLFVENPISYVDDDITISTEVFNIPRGENAALPSSARKLTELAYKRPGMEEYWQRYGLGQFSFMPLGKAVTPGYNDKIHRLDKKLDPIPTVPGYRFWDGGLNPTCLIFQITPRGQLIGLDSFVGEGIGMRQLIKTFVKPVLGSRYAKVTQWKDIGDPSLISRDVVDSDHSVAKTIESELGTTFVPGASDWHTRREACQEILNRLIDGAPALVLSRHEGILHRALRGGWHYHTDASGHVIGGNDAIPVKNIHSHPGDALSHALPVIFPHKARERGKIRINNKPARFYRGGSVTGLS